MKAALPSQLSRRPIRPFAVRIHKPNARLQGEPVVVLSASNRKGYYLVASLCNVYIRKEAHVSCLLRTPASVNIARRINRRKASRKAKVNK